MWYYDLNFQMQRGVVAIWNDDDLGYIYHHLIFGSFFFLLIFVICLVFLSGRVFCYALSACQLHILNYYSVISHMKIDLHFAKCTLVI